MKEDSLAPSFSVCRTLTEPAEIEFSPTSAADSSLEHAQTPLRPHRNLCGAKTKPGFSLPRRRRSFT